MRIFADILEQRNGHYVHALEVSSVYELETAIEQLVDSFDSESYRPDEIISFISTLEIICTEEANEDEVYDFDVEEYVIDIY